MRMNTVAEKTNNIKKVYAICFLLLMISFSVISVFCYIQNHFFVESVETTNTVITKLDEAVPFSQQYPFENNTSSINEEKSIVSNGKYINFVTTNCNAINYYLTSINPLHNKIVEWMNSFQSITYGDVVINGDNPFVILPNGYLTSVFDYCPSYDAWNNILDFSTYLKSKNLPFVTLIQPEKSDDSITTFPTGVPHGYTKTLNEYKSFLDNNDIQYVDLQPLLLKENSDLYSWFYKSDHHWNVHAAFLSARITANYLNDNLNISAEIDTLNDKKYNLITYPNVFLGSFGRILGDRWKEDIEILYPTYNTNFHVSLAGYNLDKTGSFENTLIYQDILKKDANSYCAFLYGDYPLINIENNNCQNGTRVLVIKLSYANAMCPYLASTVQYLDMIDPRHFDGSIRSYIDQTQPDCVILCIGAVIEEYEEYLTLK